MGQVSGKVAFITGGAAGIGAACAMALAAEGAAVAISDHCERVRPTRSTRLPGAW